jgi:zinc protease
MRAKRLLSLFVGVFIFIGCAKPTSSPGPVERVEIPVTKHPARASNEDVVLAAAAAASAKPQAEGKNGSAPTTKPLVYGAEEYRLVNQSDEIVSVLKNGLVVVAKRVPSPVVSVRGYVNTGGVYEGKWLGGGLSHLLEHLVAGGSSQRRTEAQNRDLLQRIGNNSNAYTSSDHTAYFINTTPQHMAEAVDLVTGWMFGALITPEEYRREYEVVQRELEKDKGEPDWVFYHLSEANRYRISPARVPVIGYQEVIQSLSRDDVFNYYKLTYIPNNMVFSVTGDLPAEEMLKAVQHQVDDVKPGREFLRDVPAEPPVLSPRTSVATFPKLGQAKLQLGFPSIRMDSPDLYAMDLLATILGGGESSLLVEELRDKRRLVNNIAAGNPTPTYVEGTFQIDMELDPETIPQATDAALKILDDVIKNGVAKERIDRAKVQMRTARVKSQQTSESIASSMAVDFINTGDPHFTDRYTKRIEEVTAEELQQVARKYFVRNTLLTTAMLPEEFVGAGGLPKAEDLIRPVAPTTKESTPADAASQVTRAELPNGTILLHKRIATSPLVEIKMYSLGGLSAEDAKSNGLGNITMKMLPRGTKTRSAQQIASFFDSIGGDLDTQSGNNSWNWSATCLKGDFEKTMDVLGDVIANPSFPEDEVKLMKQRVAAQIESQDADWHAQAMRFFRAKYFGPRNSPYQFLAIGTKENVAGFTAEQMRKFYNDNVLQGRRVIAIYGDVELDKAKSLATKHVGTGPTITDRKPPTTQYAVGESASAAAPKGTASVDVERVELNPTQQPLAGVVIGFSADSFLGDPDNYPIAVADCMSSGYGYPTGYLHEILRGRGLVYVVHAINFPGRSKDLPGNFYIYAGCDPSKVSEVVDVILENIARLQGTEKDTQPGWFQRSKQLIVTSDAMDNETPAEQAATAALDELMGLGYSYHDQFDEQITAVKHDDVRRVSSRRLNKAVVTISTPAPDAVKVEKGKREYKEFPPVDLTPRGVQHDSK